MRASLISHHPNEEPLDSQQEEVLELLLFQSSNDDDSSGGNNEPTAGSNNHKETNSIYAAVEEGNNKTRADVDRIFQCKSIRSTSFSSMYLPNKAVVLGWSEVRQDLPDKMLGRKEVLKKVSKRDH